MTKWEENIPEENENEQNHLVEINIFQAPPRSWLVSSIFHHNSLLLRYQRMI